MENYIGKKRKKNKKAVFFSTDALIALIIIFLSILVIFPAVMYSKHESDVSSDVIKVLSSLKIGELNNSYIEQLKNEGKIQDLDKSVLEQIGEFYVTNITIARVLANSVLSTIDERENIGLWYGSTPLASRNSTSIENAKDINVERQIISGVRDPSVAGESVTGFSARAYLTSALQKKYFYFGGYVGDGNISISINYTGDLKSVEIELASYRDFKIYINDILSGQYQNASTPFIPTSYSLSSYAGNFHNGSNIMKFVGVGGNLYITGGFIKITYEDSAQYEQATKYYFPGIEGLINIYDGFYSPGQINDMEISLHYDSNYTMFLNIGNISVFNESHNGETTEILDNTYLDSKLDYSSLNQKTIPLRLGLQEFQAIKAGNADVVLITDLSGSMDFRLDSDVNGITRSCNDPNLYNSTTKRLSLAKCLDKMVVDIILNASGNRLSLSAFYGDLEPPYKGRVYEEGLTNNSVYLKSRIDVYNPQSGTCICCSINDAYKILNEQSNSNRQKFVIVMSDGIPTHTCQAASGCEGTRTGLPSDEGLWLGWGAGCYGGLDDCDVNDCQCASQNANWSSCRLHNNLNATVYSIGFGALSTCTMANNTLTNIAKCGGGKYYVSDNATLLKEFYSSISKEILELSYVEQTIEVTGNISTILYPDSYIKFNYVKEGFPYGLITTSEKQFDNSYTGSFSIPVSSKILETKVVSYSGPRWTNEVKINSNSVYKLSNYGSDYIKLGDPYAINIPNSLVLGGGSINIINLTTGVSPTNISAGSNYNKIIYTLVKNISSYSPIVAFAQGCTWHIQFEDIPAIIIEIPSGYSGSNCHYIPGQHQHLEDSVENTEDAIQIAVYELLKLLDDDNNGKIDVNFVQQDLQIDFTEITGIPYAWSTEVQVRKWS